MKAKVYFLLLSFLLLSGAELLAQLAYAERVIYVSREYNNYPEAWCASQMLGPPNVYPQWGDIEQAWTPDSYGDQRDTVVLGFNNNNPISGIYIYETYTAGYIDSVWVKNSNDQSWHLVYNASPSYFGDTSRVLNVNFPMTSFPVSEIKFTVATDSATDYVQIDAVAIAPSMAMPWPVLPAFAGNSIVFDGVDDWFQSLLSTETAFDEAEKTITAWVKVNGPPSSTSSSVYDGAGIVCGSDAYVGIYLSDLGNGDSIYFYSYTGSTYAIAMDYTQGEWMHIAYVHGNDSLSAYRDGILYDRIYCPPTDGFYGGFIDIGYNYYDDHYFNGEIESVTLYDIALSQNEIRETMHASPNRGAAPGLTGHFAFNESLAYYQYGYNPMIVGNPAFVTSSLPIGPGVAKSHLESNGVVTFTGVGFEADYSAQSGGEVTATKLEVPPYAPPAGVIIDSAYWVVNQFSGTPFVADFIFHPNNPVDPGLLDCQYVLYYRGLKDFGTWTRLDSATMVTALSLGYWSMDEAALGQLLIVREGSCTSIGIDERDQVYQDLFNIFPNPSNNGVVYVELRQKTPATVHVYDLNGTEIFGEEQVFEKVKIHLPEGVYVVRVIMEEQMQMKKVIVR
jgi:hypothetical protein